jgi:Flp pilus assembly pilin Flp
MDFANTNSKRLGGFKRQAGQGMTEYIIIVALIAVAAIGVYSLFGQSIRGQVASLASEVAGDSTGAKAARDSSKGAATSAQGQAAAAKGMSDYGTSSK